MLPRSQQRLPRTRATVAQHPPQDLQQRVFRVASPCRCARASSSPSSSSAAPYDRAAVWSWQTEAALRLWTPEIYGAFRCPITVARAVPVATVDALRARRSPAAAADGIAPLLAFDFAVDVQLRALGLALANLLLPWRRGSRPAELRAQSDSGQPLPRDAVRFRVACCPGAISWPLYATGRRRAARGDAADTDEEAQEDDVGPGAHSRQCRIANASSDWPNRPTWPSEIPSFPWALLDDDRRRTLPPPTPWVPPGIMGPPGAAGQPLCRCQTLAPWQNRQNRLYHGRADCLFGHAQQPTPPRRRLSEDGSNGRPLARGRGRAVSWSSATRRRERA